MCCDRLAIYFADKIASDLDSGIEMQNLDVQECLACPLLWDSFKFVQPKDIGPWRGEASYGHACLSLMVKAARGLIEQLSSILRSQFVLKDAIVKPLLGGKKWSHLIWPKRRPV